MGVKVVDILEPYNKFSALLAQKICYLKLLSPPCGGLRSSAGFGNDTMMIIEVNVGGKG